MHRFLIAGILLALACTSVFSQPFEQVELTPLAEEYGVGYIQQRTSWWGISYFKRDGEDVAMYGASLSGLSFFYRSWAIYDVSDLPSNIEVQEISIHSQYVSGLDPLQVISYRRLTQDLRDQEAEACFHALDDLVYAWDPWEGPEMVAVLSDSANGDFESAVKESGLFMVGITGDEDFLENGNFSFEGWGHGRPSLTVVYEDLATPSETSTWGRVKALYRR